MLQPILQYSAFLSCGYSFIIDLLVTNNLFLEEGNDILASYKGVIYQNGAQDQNRYFFNICCINFQLMFFVLVQQIYFIVFAFSSHKFSICLLEASPVSLYSENRVSRQHEIDYSQTIGSSFYSITYLYTYTKRRHLPTPVEDFFNRYFRWSEHFYVPTKNIAISCL